MSESWNELFTGAVRLFLNENWATFVKSAEEQMSELETQTLDTVFSIMQLLDQEQAALSLPTDKFGKLFQARVEGLRQEFKAAAGRLSQALRYVSLDVSSNSTNRVLGPFLSTPLSMVLRTTLPRRCRKLRSFAKRSQVC